MRLHEAKYYMQKDVYYHIDGGFEVEVIAVDGTTYHVREIESGEEWVIGEDEFVSTFQQKVDEAKYYQKFTVERILEKYNELIDQGALTYPDEQSTRMYECDTESCPTSGNRTLKWVWGLVSVNNQTPDGTDVRTEQDAEKNVVQYMKENDAPFDEISRVQERYYGYDVTVLATETL